MKKRTWILSMILTIIFAFSTNGYSLHFVSVAVNPFYDPSYSNSSEGGTFNALVTVTNTNSSESYQYFQLQTEAFISFNPPISASNGWTSRVSPGGLQLFGPPPLAPGASFSFVMNYTFAPGYSALNAPWSSTGLWSMSGIVGQEWMIANNNVLWIQGGYGYSTTLTPEPGTVILLGFGLLGLGFFTNRSKGVCRAGAMGGARVVCPRQTKGLGEIARLPVASDALLPLFLPEKNFLHASRLFELR